jgi:hypothetical protein
MVIYDYQRYAFFPRGFPDKSRDIPALAIRCGSKPGAPGMNPGHFFWFLQKTLKIDANSYQR